MQPADVRYTGQLGTNIRRLRVERGWSARELARAAGVSPDTVSELEKGSRDPTLDTILRLQAAFELSSVEQLLAEVTRFFPSEILASRIRASRGSEPGAA